jgi:hypothetical protein
LREAYWDASQQVSTERYLILDGRSGEITRYAVSIQGYSDREYMKLFENVGYTEVVKYPALLGTAGEKDGNYVVFVAK